MNNVTKEILPLLTMMIVLVLMVSFVDVAAICEFLSIERAHQWE